MMLWETDRNYSQTVCLLVIPRVGEVRGITSLRSVIPDATPQASLQLGVGLIL